MKLLIKNGLLLLSDENGYLTREGNILITDQQISQILPPDAAVTGCDRVIDATDRLVMPGLINSHTHAYMSLFRNYADDLEFFDWLTKVQAVEDELTVEDSYWGTMLSIIEMIRTGTTCFVDMYMHSTKTGQVSGPSGAVSAAVNDSGIRAYLARGMVGEAYDSGSVRRFGEFFPEMELYRDHPRVHFLLGPHATYSCMPDLLARIRDIGLERNMRATIHIAESRAEFQNIQEQYHVTPMQYVADSGLFDLSVIAAHCVQVTQEDIRLMKNRNVSVAVNPRSNMKLGNGFAPVPELLEAGINLCLGTDGSGSNNTQNMFQEMNMAGLVYKGAAEKAKCVDAGDVIRFATAAGAKALGLEGQLGVIAPGALADLILLDLKVPQFVPRNDPVSALVYAANGSEVRTVIIDGQIVMEEGKLLTIDENEVYAHCEEITGRLKMHE